MGEKGEGEDDEIDDAALEANPADEAEDEPEEVREPEPDVQGDDARGTEEPDEDAAGAIAGADLDDSAKAEPDEGQDSQREEIKNDSTNAAVIEEEDEEEEDETPLRRRKGVAAPRPKVVAAKPKPKKRKGK